jgi:hypothetical protein
MLIRPEDSNGVLSGVAWLRFCSKDHDCGNQKAVTLKCPVQRHGECYGDFFASYNARDSLPSELLSPNDYCGADRLNSLDWRTANLKSTSVSAALCDPSLNAFGGSLGFSLPSGRTRQRENVHGLCAPLGPKGALHPDDVDG